MKHEHHCPFCNKHWACKELECIEEAGEELACPLCEHDLRETDETDHLSSV